MEQEKNKAFSESSVIPIFLALIFLFVILFLIFNSKELIFKLINNEPESIGKAFTYSIFILVSLIPTIILFGILKSSTAKVSSNKSAKFFFEFGGPMAAFFVILYLLINSYQSSLLSSSMDRRIEGNVRFEEDGKITMASKVNIGLSGCPGVKSVLTDEMGNFIIKFPENKELSEQIEIIVLKSNVYYSHTIKRSERMNAKIIINIGKKISETGFIKKPPVENSPKDFLPKNILNPPSFIDAYVVQKEGWLERIIELTEEINNIKKQNRLYLSNDLNGLIVKNDQIKMSYSNRTYEKDELLGNIDTLKKDLKHSKSELQIAKDKLLIQKEMYKKEKTIAPSIIASLDDEIRQLERTLENIDIQTQVLASIEQSISL